MNDPKELKLGPVGNDAELNADSSQWSVSAIVILGDAGLHRRELFAEPRRFAPLSASHCPEVEDTGDRVFVRDGALVTSAGSGPTIDFGLSLIQEDLGRDVVLDGARRLVLLLKQPGDQSRFSVHLTAHTAESSRLYKVQQYILDHPAADLSVGALARIAAMSARNFTRVFTREMGIRLSTMST